MRHFHFLVVNCMVALPACGGEVVREAPGEAGAGGAGATAAVTASAQASGAGGAATTSGAGGEVPLFCGGRGGLPCPAEDFCDWSDDSCGGDDGSGTCLPKPEACDEDCPGVCGCDGELYCNACIAHGQGVDVSTSVSCLSAGGSVTATYWSGGLDHLVIGWKDERKSLCLILQVAWPMSSPPGFEVAMPAEWGASGATLSNVAADCDDPIGQGMGTLVSAVGASGTLDWVVPPGQYAPCDVAVVDVSVTFPEGTPWAPSNVVLSATEVPVVNGCM